jgi:hypothetical protein
MGVPSVMFKFNIQKFVLFKKWIELNVGFTEFTSFPLSSLLVQARAQV